MTLLRLARADFLERVRRPAYFVTLGFMVYAAHAFLPPNHAIYTTFQLGGHRGVYNSSWVGALVAVLGNIFIAFAGFYLVKGAVERDRATGVGQILAASRLSTARYLLAKVVSNMAVLASMVAVLAVAAGVVQWVRAEDRSVNLFEIVEPLVILALPVMAVVSAVAVLFETIPKLRGGFGNVAYFFMWCGFMSSGVARGKGAADPTGLSVVKASAVEACRRAFPDYSPEADGMSVGFNFRAGSEGRWNLTTFTWDGVDWTVGDVAPRLLWVLIALTITMLGALWFDRFDTSGARAVPSVRRRRGRSRNDEVVPAVPVAPARLVHVGDIPLASRGAGLFALVRAELALMLRGRSRWWWIVALGAAVACGLVPAGTPRTLLYGLAWIWPVLLWSSMGVRERQFGTADLFFSAPRPLRRQLLALWVAGFLVAVGAAAGVGVRTLVDGDLVRFGTWLAGAAFIPSFALACGVWSGGSKLFEVLYLLLWYGGAINAVPFLDYGGFSPELVSSASSLICVVSVLGLTALALLGRARNIS